MSLIDIIKNETILAPGVYDPLSALIAQKAGFKALYLSGASISYTYLGMQDLSFTNLTDVESALRRIKNRVDVPIICDADTGYGNEDNVAYTVRVLERSGASAIQLEDQNSPKRCGHLAGKEIIPAQEMVLKIKTAVAARRDAAIIARTDAITVSGIEEAIFRANMYMDAGADIAFVESPRNKEEVNRIAREVQGLKLINMVEGGKTPIMDFKDLRSIGFNIVIFPGSAVRTVTYAMENLFRTLYDTGSTTAYRDRMLDFNQLQDILRLQMK
jgi:2-methylisocitrate lyase-like PEP mutase family enzyme